MVIREVLPFIYMFLQPKKIKFKKVRKGKISKLNFKSNKLVNASKGLANSLGYKVNIKPHIQIATRAADYHCK